MRWPVILVALFGAASAALAQAPSTLPTSAPAAVDIEPLLAQLSSDNWQERKAAQDKIAAAGETVTPRLKQFIQTSQDLEARTAAEAILSQIAEGQKLGPTLITIHFKHTPAEKVLSEIAKQADVDIKLYADGRAGGGGTPISIDADAAPFWRVMQDFCQKAKLTPRSMGMDEGLTLMPSQMAGGLAEGMAGASFESGAFFVVVGSTTATQTVMYTKPEKHQSTVYIRLNVYVEPKISVAGYSRTPDVEEAIDDAGKSWKASDQPEAAAGAAEKKKRDMQQELMMRGAMGRREQVLDIQLPLTRPAECGKRLAKLRGTVRAMVSNTDRIEFDNVMNVKNVAKDIGGGKKVVLRNVTERMGGDDHLTVILAVLDENNAPAQMRGMFAPEIQRASGIRLVDDQGRAWYRPGMVTPRPNRKGELEYEIDFMRNGPGANAGDPVKLVWDRPGTPREMKVPFEFADLALPKGPDELP